MKFEDTDVYHDAIVQDTLNAVAGVSAYATMEDVNENPVLKLLVETDTLDATSAAVILADTLAPGGYWNDTFDKVPAEVGKAWALLHEQGLMAPDCKALFAADNPTVIKLAVGGIAAACASDDLKREMGAGGYGTKEMVVELCETCAGMAERIIEHKAWETLPAPLLDKFVEGIDTLKGLTDSPLIRKGLAVTVAELKTAMAQDNAQDMATPAAKPAPESPFEQLKDTARKKYRL